MPSFLLAVVLGSLMILAGPLVTLAGPTLATDDCAFERGTTTCASTAARTETVERTMVGECPAGPAGAPGRRVRTFLDTYTVTETTTSRQGSDGRPYETRTVEVGRELVSSQLISDTCTAAS